MKHLETAQMLALLKAAKQVGPREHALILLAYQHGMRASECCNLLMTDLDMAAQTVTVRRLKGSRLTVQPLHRHVGEPLLDEIKVLKAWLAERGESSSPYVFTSQKSPKLDRRTVTRIVHEVGQRAGIAVYPHMLKHSLCTHMLAADVNVGMIQQAAGHKAIASTMRYAHANDGQAGKARDAAMLRLYA